MNQVYTGCRTVTVTAADTNKTPFASYPCRYVLIQARTGNAGAVVISGVTAGTVDDNGLSLAAGVVAPRIEIDNLNKLGYKAAGAGYILDILVFN